MADEEEIVYRPPAIAPALVRCLRCQNPFASPDRRAVRVCGRCKGRAESERLGRLADSPGNACGMDTATRDVFDD